MTFHPGKVVRKINPEDESVESADDDVQATVEMWDGNLFTFIVEEGIEDDVEKGATVLVDYRPLEGASVPVARQEIVKVLKGELASEVWKKYEGFKESKRKKQIPQTTPVAQPSYMG